MPFDVPLVRALNSIAGKYGWLDTGIVFFASWFPYILGAVAATAIFAMPLGDARWRVVFIAFLAALVARFGIVEFIYRAYKKPRPYMTHRLHALVVQKNPSFPSGHAAFFAALAAVLYELDTETGVAYFLATCVMSTARVAAGTHYPSDILGGLVIGILVGVLVARVALASVL